MLNLDQLDPDWDLATKHGQANKSGKPINSDSNTANQEFQICPCCFQHLNKEEISIWEHSKQLEFLGFGFPLFYTILKYCIALLLISIAAYNAYELKNICHQSSNTQNLHRLLTSQYLIGRNLAEAPQSRKTCLTFMVEMANINETVTTNDQTVRLASFALHLLALIYIRNSIIKLGKYYDQRTTSLSDYSIFVKGINKMKGIQKNLATFFEKQFKKKYIIKQITLLPQYTSIQQLEQQKKNIINTLRGYYKKPDFDEQNKSQQMEEILKKFKQVQQKIQRQVQQSKLNALDDNMQCQKVICVFQTEDDKQDILNEFKNITTQNKKKYFGQIGAESIYLKEAPDPTEIIWRNANLPRAKRILLIFLGWGLSLVLLVVVFIIIYFILGQKNLLLSDAQYRKNKNLDDVQANQQYKEAIALVYILIFLVVLFNKMVLSVLLSKFTELQRHTTTSKFQFSYSLKLTLCLFATTALMTLAVQAITFKNYYSHLYGVVDQETIMFLINSFFLPLLWLINPFRIIKLIKRKLYFGKKYLTQRQANELMQQQRYDVGKRFAEIMQMMWFTYFYSTLIPIGVVATAFGLILYYWVDKYNLLKRSTVVGNVSVDIIYQSLTILDFTLLCFPVGSVIFDTQIHTTYHNSSIVMIVIAAVYIMLPKNKLIDIFYNQKFNTQQKTYTQVKHTFHKTYHTEHPIYRKIYYQKLQKKVNQKGFKLLSSKKSLNDGNSLIKQPKLLFSTSLIQQTSANQIKL